MTRNYFKSKTSLVFFSHNDQDDTIRAYAQATELGGEIAVFRAPLWRGPWDACQIVGHRLLRDIVMDIAADESPALLIELSQLPIFVVEA